MPGWVKPASTAPQPTIEKWIRTKYQWKGAWWCGTTRPALIGALTVYTAPATARPRRRRLPRCARGIVGAGVRAAVRCCGGWRRRPSVQVPCVRATHSHTRTHTRTHTNTVPRLTAAPTVRVLHVSTPDTAQTWGTRCSVARRPRLLAVPRPCPAPVLARVLGLCRAEAAAAAARRCIGLQSWVMYVPAHLLPGARCDGRAPT